MLKPTVALLFLCLALPASAQAAESAADATFFQEKVAPILIGHCLECHSTTKEGGLDLRSKQTAMAGGDSGSVLTPGDSGDSLLFEYVATHEMPPKRPLNDQQVASIKKWIDDGAYFPERPLHPFAVSTDTRAGFDWWSLQPLQVEEPPVQPQSPAGWQDSAIDRFVYRKLAGQKLTPSEPASPRVLIRRATYDLIGLPPTPAEVEAFLQASERETGAPNQAGDSAYAALIDRLLASPHYGEQWGRHWLDVVRFGESNGYERNVIHTTVWPFRDYVIRSLNDDKPFNRFIQEHLAGDVLGPDNPDVAVGTAFLVCGPYDNVGNQDKVAAAQIRADAIDEMIRATGGGFLGLTVGCSRCHDHKFDPISQRDYYSLYATFAGVKHGERVLNTKLSSESAKQLTELERELAEVDRQLRQFEPPAFTGRTIVIDDEAESKDAKHSPSVTLLAAKRGHGSNPAGASRGHRGDAGDIDRSPNISGHRYLWWDNQPGKDLFTWNPAAAGTFRVWLSWGCGWPTHTADAQYVLDLDGDLATTADQQIIATVDQQHFAGGPEVLPKKLSENLTQRGGQAHFAPKTPQNEPVPDGFEVLPKLPLWSGFHDAGVHQLDEKSRIVLRGGKTGTAITADVMVLQDASPAAAKDATSPTQPRFRDPVDARLNRERFAPTPAKYIRFTIHRTNGLEPCLDELEVFSAPAFDSPTRNVALDAKATSSGDYAGNPKHKLSHINDGKYGNSFSWISNQSGRGWVELELPEVQTIDSVVWARDREEKYTDRLAVEYEIAVATEPGRWRVVATSHDRLTPELLKSTPVSPRLLLTREKPKWRKLPACDPAIAQAGSLRHGEPDIYFSNDPKLARPLIARRANLIQKQDALKHATRPPKWWVGNFLQDNGPFQVFLGGDPQRRGSSVQPASMQTLANAMQGFELPATAPESQRRLALANWITSDENALALRVLANRVWHYHFGTGIVNTPSDFGFAGGKPSHPLLLDWLAARLKAHGWRLKPLHKEIMLSHTYRQASDFRPAAAEMDGDSRLLWRFPPRRLEGEEIRDATLAVAGKLDSRMGGPGFRLFRYVQDNVATYHPLDTHGPETYRRGVYHHRARAMQIDLLTEFDTPDCAFSVPRRWSTTTPLQALTLLNHSFTLDMATAFAERLQAAHSDRRRQIAQAFELAFSRPPRAEEQAAAMQLVVEHGLRALCRALLNSNEFIYLN